MAYIAHADFVTGEHIPEIDFRTLLSAEPFGDLSPPPFNTLKRNVVIAGLAINCGIWFAIAHAARSFL